MSYTKAGWELLVGTVLYYMRSPYDAQEVYRIVKTEGRFYGCNYIFDPNDKLWATKLVRITWDRKNHHHPHCTLFQILHKKLEI
jgi:hypothetical protein